MANDIFNQEKAIGKRAAQMAQNYAHQVLKQKLTIHNRGSKGVIPILQATKIKEKMGKHRLLGLNFTSSKVGFMLHYGFAGVREGANVHLKASRYQASGAVRAPHQAKLKSYHLFEDLYKKSGALDYLIDSLGATRTEAIMAKMQNLMLQLNTQDK